MKVLFIFLLVIFNHANAQVPRITPADTCAYLKGVKVYIPDIDSNNFTIPGLKRGFTLTTNNTAYTIIEFCIAYIDERAGGWYAQRRVEGNKFDPEELNFLKNIEGAKMLFIDRIFVKKDNKRYCVRPIVYPLKQ